MVVGPGGEEGGGRQKRGRFSVYGRLNRALRFRQRSGDRIADSGEEPDSEPVKGRVGFSSKGFGFGRGVRYERGSSEGARPVYDRAPERERPLMAGEKDEKLIWERPTERQLRKRMVWIPVVVGGIVLTGVGFWVNRDSGSRTGSSSVVADENESVDGTPAGSSGSDAGLGAETPGEGGSGERKPVRVEPGHPYVLDLRSVEELRRGRADHSSWTRAASGGGLALSGTVDLEAGTAEVVVAGGGALVDGGRTLRLGVTASRPTEDSSFDIVSENAAVRYGAEAFAGSGIVYPKEGSGFFGAEFSIDVDRRGDDIGVTVPLMPERAPEQWKGAGDSELGFALFVEAWDDQESAVVRHESNVGTLPVADGAVATDTSLTFTGLRDYRLSHYSRELPNETRQCAMEEVALYEELGELFRSGIVGPNLFRACLQVAFADSGLATTTEEALSGFSPEAVALAECVFDNLDFEGLTVAEVVQALEDPTASTWSPGFIDAYADALEKCFPLRPYYRAIFGSFAFDNPACVDLVTEIVLREFPWAVQIIGGVLNDALRGLGQKAFSDRIVEIYVENDCLAAN